MKINPFSLIFSSPQLSAIVPFPEISFISLHFKISLLGKISLIAVNPLLMSLSLNSLVLSL